MRDFLERFFGGAFGGAFERLASEDGFKGVAHKFGADLLGRSLSVERGKPRGDTLTDLLRADFLVTVDLVRDERGAYLM